MTAEISIMNKIGVALAADSAVTLGGGEGKIYTSADKLFQLSTVAPVAIMVYGNTNLAAVPWETIIKTYRIELGHKTYAKLEGYMHGLIRFISSNPRMFKPRIQKREAVDLIKLLFENVRDDIYEKLERDCGDNTKISETKIKKAASKVIGAKLDIVLEQDLISGIPKNIRTTLRKKLIGDINSLQRQIFKRLPITAEAKRKLRTMCFEVLTRAVFSSGISGVVIAGFGEKEYSPSLLDFGIDGLIENKPRYLIRNKHVIDDNTISSIVPFAQKEVVYTFMEGIDPRLEIMINETTTSLFFGVADTIINQVKEETGKLGRGLKQKIDNALKKLLIDLFKSWKTQRRNVHWGPVTSIVSSLPKDELAAMAESLVNLTKFRRRVSTERETVGGPVDVAIITKGDGFIWVKRKHYFDPWLNIRSMGRFLRETVEDGKK